MFEFRRKETGGERVDQLAAMPLPGSPVVAVLGPKGGGSQTTTAVGLGRTLAPRVPGTVVLDDWNPEKTTMLECLGLPMSQIPRRMVDLVREIDQIRNPVDWAPYLDRVGRVHVLHNEGATLLQVDAITLEDYQRVLAAQRAFAAINIIDTGTSTVHPACRAALQVADKLVIGLIADPKVVNVTKKAVGELVDGGYGQLVRESTVVISVTVPGTKREVIDRAVEFFSERVRSVVVVPFDRALAAGQPTRWDAIRPKTAAALSEIAVSVLEVLHERRPAAQVPYFSTGPAAPAREAWPAPAPAQVMPTAGIPQNMQAPQGWPQQYPQAVVPLESGEQEPSTHVAVQPVPAPIVQEPVAEVPAWARGHQQ